ncbi:MAG: PH domain-containing protein [Jatrophihabitans sp.]|uniref:PH domain-containing protein n=1 Tax=Jatrophihabitans sp. TaxID=1932789 RepID=UPI003914D534
MAIMSSLTGNAGPLGIGQAHDEFARLLGPGEVIYAAFEFVRDVMLFTNGRLILVDKQGITGKKVEYHSYPYRSILHFSVQTEGHLMAEARMHIYVDGMKDPIEKEFNDKVDIYQVQGILSAFVVPK